MAYAKFAKLVDKKVVEFVSERDFIDYLNAGNEFNKKIARDEIEFGSETYIVSTVFLGTNHGIQGVNDTDLWFETMVFKADENKVVNYSHLYCKRALTYDEAEQNHANVVKIMIEMIKRGKVDERNLVDQ